MKKKLKSKIRTTFNELFSSPNQTINKEGKTLSSPSDQKEKKSAVPIEKPADLGAKPADLEAKPADLEAKPADSGGKPVNSITKAQALTRGFLARKNYGIQQLAKEELQLYPILIKGNDPELSKEQEKGLPRHRKEEKIALIGTSGMRSVELACQLSEGVPKLIILDNSIQVTLFWRKAKDIILHANDENDFLSPLKAYISKDCKELDLSLYMFGHRSSKKLNNSGKTSEEFSYLEALFKKYSFEQIKKIISIMSIIKQSWADKDVFIKIKNILTYTNITTIYAYPSNIVAYMNDDREEAEKILENIQKLNPELAIHTDSIYIIGKGNRPENLYFVFKNNHNPSEVRKLLKIENTVDNEDDNQDSPNEFLIT
ncbi:hypothetical protein [Legionella gresilensis]|uniref:hypothetical protein n=1 Tax=Legionella gresilensis TaxID=91823 RepID=UPI001041B02E|nr:hypothetical protein [Legionella gresilensis]